MSSWERIADLPLRIDGYRTERRAAEIASGFTRVTTTVVLEGAGHTGEGEDVTYEPKDHEAFPTELALAGDWTLASYSDWLEGRPLFSPAPSAEAYADYRRWAFESAALDLALRQAGTSFAAAFGREARPLRFVVSTRAAIEEWLDLPAGYEFKLDPEPEWSEHLIDRLAASGRVRVLDLKAFYHGTAVDLAPDPDFYRMLAGRFPETVIEDPALDPACLDALDGAAGRLSFDAPIHSLADVDALPVDIRWLNIKPSRFGSTRRLLECIDACAERGVTMYGGGQTELGPGRRQIQMLASVFYADTPNDVAPAEFNVRGPRPDLPASPLPMEATPGF
jgi:hypothetical protein